MQTGVAGRLGAAAGLRGGEPEASTERLANEAAGGGAGGLRWLLCQGWQIYKQFGVPGGDEMRTKELLLAGDNKAGASPHDLPVRARR